VAYDVRSWQAASWVKTVGGTGNYNFLTDIANFRQKRSRVCLLKISNLSLNFPKMRAGVSALNFALLEVTFQAAEHRRLLTAFINRPTAW